VHGNGNAATVMLGLPGFVLLAVLDLAARLSTRSRRVRKCPACGVLARLHDRRFSDVRDLPATGRAVTLVWIKRIWRCMESDCATRTWTETSEAIRARASLTERASRGVPTGR